MNIKHFAPAGALAAALFSSGAAHADFVLDTGTPLGSSVDVVNSSTWYAEEFYLSAGQSITSVSAYLTLPNGGSLATANGTPFTFAVYSDAGPGGSFLGSTSANRSADQVASVGGEFTANGWTSASLSWTPTTSGYYWLAIQQSTTGSSYTLDAPTENSAATGTAPAVSYAIYSTTGGSKFQKSTANPIGLEVTAVPLPAAAWLLISGLGGLGTWVRRRRAV